MQKYSNIKLPYILVDNCKYYSMFKQFIGTILHAIAKVIGFVPALIYGYVYSEYFTKATYRRIAERNNPSAKAVLDIGTATGHPLHSIIDSFKDAKVVGIDINKNYVPACKKLFEKNTNVTIQLLNFYELSSAFPNTTFDTIIFGSSFMLMPDQSKAIEIAKKHLSKNGKIYILLTLYDKRTRFNRFMEYAKPLLKYLTTVDFGTVTYKSDFEDFLHEHQLNPNLKERCSGNLMLKIFPFYIYQAQISA